MDSVAKVGNIVAKARAVSTMQQHYHAILTFGLFLQENPESVVATNLKLGLSPLNTKHEWANTLYHFKNFLEKNYPNSTQQKVATSMGMWTNYLSGEGVCPTGLVMLVAKKVNRNPQRKTLIDVELTALGYKALKKIKENICADDEFSGTGELESICNNIALDFEDASLFKDKSMDVEMSGCTTLKNRLDLIYQRAVDMYLSAKKRREEGKQLVISGKAHAVIINDWLEASSLRVRSSRGVLDEVRKLTDEQFYAGIMSWCMTYHEHPGLHPYEGQTCNKKLIRIRNEFYKRKSISFKASEFIELIGVSRELLTSVYVIIMFETWANPNSISRLEIKDKKNINDSLSVIDWKKPRAGAILSQYDNAKSLGLSEVIDYLINATANYRLRAISVDRSSLFLHAYASDAKAKGRTKINGVEFIVRPSGAWVNDSVKKLTLELSEGKWVATPKQIRTSLILQHALKHGIESAKEKAKHKSARTTQLYTGSMLLKYQKEKKMREFLDWLETLVTIKVQDIPRKLGLNEAEYEEKKQLILSSNFGGVYCSDAYSGYQEGSVVGSPCSQVVRCMTCEKRMNVLVASKENITHLLYWKQTLERACKSNLITTKDSGWMQWQTFVSYAYERLLKSVRHKGLLIETELTLSSVDNPYPLSIFK